MASVIQNNFRVRKNYAKITKIIDIPNLIDIQKQSYDKFLQKDTPSEPVSYTHLDVYKRQVQSWTWALLSNINQTRANAR